MPFREVYESPGIQASRFVDQSQNKPVAVICKLIYNLKSDFPKKAPITDKIFTELHGHRILKDWI